ncbi:hypothetical protein [Amycolatopsis sp. NPDC004079]|uniref:hypothetical protein n=1 Tax=Amycolatopsis sp. NPDC004079 TaxID=3154549 RepID=UPI0033A8EFFE
MKVIQHILRQSSMKVTTDIYANVTQEVAARKLASAIPRQAALHRARALRLTGDHNGQCSVR